MRPATDDVNFDFFEVGKNRNRQIFVPSIPLGWEGILGMQFFSGFLGPAYKAVTPIGAEKIIGTLLASLNLRPALNLNLTFGLNQPGSVLHVPAEGAKERIKKIFAEFGFHAVRAFEFGKIAFEDANQTIQFLFKRLKRSVGCQEAKIKQALWRRQFRVEPEQQTD